MKKDKRQDVSTRGGRKMHKKICSGENGGAKGAQKIFPHIPFINILGGKNFFCTYGFSYLYEL